jgi:acyl-CoA thioesterase-1
MRKLKNKQLHSNIKGSVFNVFTKLCYFLTLILLLSCGSDTAKKEENTKKESTKIVDEKTATNTSKNIVFFGDSLTAGYGLEDMNDAFPGLIQAKIDSLSLDYTVINSGLSGETSSGGKNRINWVLNQDTDIFILELGANDGLRGIPLSETRKNLQDIIDAVHAKNSETKIIVVGMQIPPNMGNEYTSEFKTIFPALAKKNNVSLVPFLLKDVGGIPSLNQEDGIHPTKEGQKILAKNVWEILEPLL